MSVQRPSASVAFLPSVCPFPSSSRKRRAASPPSPSSLSPPLANLWPTTHSRDISNPDKRRRPNLANGFSGLSISRRREHESDSPLPTYEESLATKHEVDDGDQTSWRSSQPDAIRVEDISDHRVKPLRRRRESSESSDSSVSVNDDADFRLPGSTLWRPAQQADEIEQPDMGTPRAYLDLVVEDVTSQTPVRGRKRRDEEDDSPRKRQRGFEMDIDEEHGEGSRRRGRHRTQWHEPEKDRESRPGLTVADESGIVITSLGSPSSSRSTSSDRSCSSRHLTQPGCQGFTLSPSFLTHLIAAQRDQPSGPRGRRDLARDATSACRGRRAV